MVDIIERTANECLVPLTVGGGIRSVDDMKMFLSVGADKISVNSSAIKDPKIITEGLKIWKSMHSSRDRR